MCLLSSPSVYHIKYFLLTLIFIIYNFKSGDISRGVLSAGIIFQKECLCFTIPWKVQKKLKNVIVQIIINAINRLLYIIKSLCLHSSLKFDCKTAKSIDYLITESSKIIISKGSTRRLLSTLF